MAKLKARSASRSGAVKWGYDKDDGAIVLEACGEIGRKLPLHQWLGVTEAVAELGAVRRAIWALQEAPQIQAEVLPVVTMFAARRIAQLEQSVRSVLALSPRLRADLSELDKRLRTASEASDGEPT